MLGNFNINALCDEINKKFKNLTEGYQLVVIEPTHSDGGLLDHVHLKSFLFEIFC